MVGLKEICALLLAGGLGAGAVVTVQKARPAVSKKAKPAGARHVSSQGAAGPRAVLSDCPAQVASLARPMELPPIPPMEQNAATLQPGAPAALGAAAGGGGIGTPSFIGPSEGGIGAPGRTPVSQAGVPEPGTWLMLVSGFGLIGLAMRNRPTQEPAE